MHVAIHDAALDLDLIRLLISKGADIHAEDRAFFARNVDMMFLIREPLLCFLKAVSAARDPNISRSLRCLADNPDLTREVVKFL